VAYKESPPRQPVRHKRLDEKRLCREIEQKCRIRVALFRCDDYADDLIVHFLNQVSRLFKCDSAQHIKAQDYRRQVRHGIMEQHSISITGFPSLVFRRLKRHEPRSMGITRSLPRAKCFCKVIICCAGSFRELFSIPFQKPNELMNSPMLIEVEILGKSAGCSGFRTTLNALRMHGLYLVR
jgi:hypothetical protein